MLTTRRHEEEDIKEEKSVRKETNGHRALTVSIVSLLLD